MPHLMVSSDAAASEGCGVILGKEWTVLELSKSVTQLSIAVMELIPIVSAGYIWGRQWQRKNVLYLCDNRTVVDALISGISKDRELSILLTELAILAVLNNFRYFGKHVPGKANNTADALSRFDFQAFHRLMPTARERRLPTTAYLLKLFYNHIDFKQYEDIMWGAMCNLAFFGFLRVFRIYYKYILRSQYTSISHRYYG